MQDYETEDNYTAMEIAEWGAYLDKELCTAFEVNESASGLPDEYYIVIMDLTHNEVAAIRAFELFKMRKKVSDEL